MNPKLVQIDHYKNTNKNKLMNISKIRFNKLKININLKKKTSKEEFLTK